MAIELTEAERDVLLRLGSDSDYESVPRQVLDQLTAKGILYFRDPDRRLDFTELGNHILDELQGVSDDF